MDQTLIKKIIEDKGLPAYRYRQIVKNYFSGRFTSFQEMSDLPLTLRKELEDQHGELLSVNPEKVIKDKFSSKAILRLKDGYRIESVLMTYEDWHTVCVSSQVGCPLKCSFCATGQMGFKRNLTSEEIVDQIIFWNHVLKPEYVGRVVFMGMGEPFLNWENLTTSLNLLNNKEGLNIGQRKISISTAGIVPKIEDFAKLNTQINLAVSLHSAIQRIRERIMPIAKSYTLDSLIVSLNKYVKATKRQVFFEYALIKDVNDRDQDIKALSSLINSNHLFYLNLIPLNPVKGGLSPTTKERQREIEKYLTKEKVSFSIRHSIGRETNSACGQLIVEN